MDRPRPTEIVAIGSAVVAGLAGAVVALGARDADTDFLRRQEQVQVLRVAAVERVVRTAPDPAVGTGEGTRARCRPQGDGPLRNPWQCTVSYASGHRARIAVQVADDGSYTGRYSVGGSVEGCCIELPDSR